MAKIETTTIQDAAVVAGAVSIILTNDQIAVIKGPATQPPPPPVDAGSPPPTVDGHAVRVVPAILNGGRVSLGEIGTDIIAVKVPNVPGKFKVSFSQDGSAGSSFVAYATVRDWNDFRWTKATATPVDIHNPPAGTYCVFRWDSKNMKPVNTQAQVRIQVEV